MVHLIPVYLIGGNMIKMLSVILSVLILTFFILSIMGGTMDDLYDHYTLNQDDYSPLMSKFIEFVYSFYGYIIIIVVGLCLVFALNYVNNIRG